ncbi:hypothetical protein TCAL_15575 [Tigriopus californicus]|uniref:Ribonuclease H1 N-terminal domain-containing protein n=1 Tax=Tigriopus californicus TaxID=6832 RepID=A0A553PAU6_TIGCA|nr:uncharacterized protein LOC131893479 isoform X1 [Tigriopus californicus]XP_059099498.1 uncharacterized protein LOC131893479 isoform X1 [Tigriopus californicus]XP_059099499.1 uncharacterized protein LOC131893479 isoform X1 [Tigriopus californicus]TRY74788.1 hypothetical protein TCAL_15575 [Tigriopus californicus]
MGRHQKNSGIKYYVVIHGKCPGIYDKWQQVQFNIKGFPNSEYTSKSSKHEAVELFQSKRPDWPRNSIPDFTIHASNRLEPLGKKSSADSIESIHVEGSRGRSSSLTGMERMSRKGKHEQLGDFQIEVPSANRPEKITLQQNWLHDPYNTPSSIPRTPSPGYFSPQNVRQGSTSPLSHSNSMSSLLAVPNRAEIEFDRQELLGLAPDRILIGAKSPAPVKHKNKGDLNLPAISAPASLRSRPRDSSVSRAPSIELYPDPDDVVLGVEGATAAERRERRRERGSKDKRTRKSKRSKERKARRRKSQ